LPGALRAFVLLRGLENRGGVVSWMGHWKFLKRQPENVLRR
jgi:hypothetical protein